MKTLIISLGLILSWSLSLVCFLLFSGCSEETEDQLSPPGMVLIPAGKFQMGSMEGDVDERPVHMVNLDAFYIDVHEVTNTQYRQFVESIGYFSPNGTGYTAEYGVLDYNYQPWLDPEFNQPEQPVTNVTWFDAAAYCRWKGKRLPTEAEWEKAALGNSAGIKYPWGDDEPGNRSANFSDINTTFEWRSSSVNDGFVFTSPVKSFEPNGYGLFDMAGNVWEWCADWYDVSYYVESDAKNPKGPEIGERRVLRGGAWYRASHCLRAAERVSDYPDNSLNVVGFRCAMDIR